jgi:hypothetical protein
MDSATLLVLFYDLVSIYSLNMSLQIDLLNQYNFYGNTPLQIPCEIVSSRFKLPPCWFQPYDPNVETI